MVVFMGWMPDGGARLQGDEKKMGLKSEYERTFTPHFDRTQATTRRGWAGSGREPVKGQRFGGTYSIYFHAYATGRQIDME
jgi:hypothetical protein